MSDSIKSNPIKVTSKKRKCKCKVKTQVKPKEEKKNTIDIIQGRPPASIGPTFKIKIKKK